MSLPNLGALRLTVPTSELFPITAEDQENNDGQPFEDPSDYEELPLNSETRTFRVEKVPGNPERGYNWHDTRNLAEWVKRQIEDGKFPVVDPYRTPMSKSDIDQLRFEIDQDIPPYDPSAPVSEPSDEEVYEEPSSTVGMEFSAEYDLANNYHENTYTIECHVESNTTPDLFERLAPYFMERQESSMSSYYVSNLSLNRLSHREYDTRETSIRNKTFRLMEAMRRMDLPIDSDVIFKQLQYDFQLALHELAGTLMRQLLENGGYMHPGTNMHSKFIMFNRKLSFEWRFSRVRNAFFETIQSQLVEVVDDEDLEFPEQDLFRSILQTFGNLFETIILHARFQMSATPRFLAFEDSDLRGGTHSRYLRFDVVPRPSAPEPERG